MGSTLPFARIERAMNRAVADRVFPGAVLAWGIGDSPMLHRAYGVRDETTGEPVTLNTIYDLASLTKPLATALALSDLIEKERVNLLTPLGTILPCRAGNKAGITIDMLLRHTSGLAAYRKYFKRMPDVNPRQALRQMILEEPLEYTPGKKEIYSDLGYILLAWVIEEVSSCRLDHYVRKFIYEPLGIDTLFFVSPGNRPTHLAGVAATSRCPWRGRLIKGEVEDENAWAAGGIEGHAGLFGDALAVYQLCSEIMSALIGKETEVLDSGVIRSFVQRVPEKGKVAGFDTPSKINSSAGRYFSSRAVGHLGFTGTSFWMDPETGLRVVLLTNRVHPSRENLGIRKFRPFIHDMISKMIL